MNLFFIFSFTILLLIGIVYTIHVYAVGPSDTVAVEPENGSLTGPVSIGTDSAASNGKYVLFNAVVSVTPTLTPTQSQLTLSNLTVADTGNTKNYSLQTNIQQGNTLYGDRTYTIKSLPLTLAGSQWIRTANNSKSWNAGNTLINFTINKQAVVFVPVDTRLKKLAWMDASWTDSKLKLLDNEKATITFAIFQKTFPAGPITLGPNAGGSASDMYTVIVQ